MAVWLRCYKLCTGHLMPIRMLVRCTSRRRHSFRRMPIDPLALNIARNLSGSTGDTNGTRRNRKLVVIPLRCFSHPSCVLVVDHAIRHWMRHRHCIGHGIAWYQTRYGRCSSDNLCGKCSVGATTCVASDVWWTLVFGGCCDLGSDRRFLAFANFRW